MNSRQERDQFIAYLKNNGVTALTHFVPLHSSPYGKKATRVFGSMEVTDDVFNRSLRLPMYSMSDEEINYVLKIIDAYFNKKL